MVKRRYFLFLFYVAALSVVSCQDEAVDEAFPEGPLPEGPLSEDALPAAQDEGVDLVLTDESYQSAVPYDDVVIDDIAQPEEPATKKPKKPRKTTEAPVAQSCAQILVAEQNDCLFNVPEGYDANSCKFDIKNEECDWECACEAYLTEATTEEPIHTDAPDSDEESMESCETDKKIKFKNCFIDIDGFVKRAKANPC